MSEVIAAILASERAFKWLFFLCVLLVFYRWVNRNNDFELWHLIATRSQADAKHYLDIDKVGNVTGILVGSYAVILLSDNDDVDLVGFAAVLATYFAFVGGVAGYSAYLRAKSGRSETTVVTEPVPSPQPSKTTTKTSVPSPAKTTVEVEPMQPKE